MRTLIHTKSNLFIDRKEMQGTPASNSKITKYFLFLGVLWKPVINNYDGY